MESVRVQLTGNRIKAYGRIVAAATQSHPAFSASYDLVTDETGATKRLSLTVTLAERERQLSIARDEENMWLVQPHTGETSRAAYGGALDVDVIFSPFFNALPIRRTGLYQRSESVAIPVVYVRLPELSVEAATISYSSAADGIKLHSPVGRDHGHRRLRTGSSSTTQGWQSGSDHPARTACGGELFAPPSPRRPRSSRSRGARSCRSAPARRGPASTRSLTGIFPRPAHRGPG